MQATRQPFFTGEPASKLPEARTKGPSESGHEGLPGSLWKIISLSLHFHIFDVFPEIDFPITAKVSRSAQGPVE